MAKTFKRQAGAPRNIMARLRRELPIREINYQAWAAMHSVLAADTEIRLLHGIFTALAPINSSLLLALELDENQPYYILYETTTAG